MTALSPDALEFQEINHDVSTIFLPLSGRKDIARGLGASDISGEKSSGPQGSVTAFSRTVNACFQSH